MATDIVRWCDPCRQVRGEDVPAAPYEIAPITSHGKSKILDLCEDCKKTLIDPLERLLETAPFADGQSYHCPHCSRAYPSRALLNAHIKQGHPTVEPANGPRTRNTRYGQFPCEFPDCDYVAQSPQGRAAHSRSHR